ncbi:alpha/beta hydrolase [Actinoplanes sp. TBRC 11911]|uniref:alpha/beta fold hydrolase n=1 Tax=Actinoplanes sp. TBRC 11911 TaxID=2729386 RepID=UPI00145E2368|nr:alpha/beta hydrolase [Actinoplanes sp. TBRC 11911]NMO50133.1 alpha/beta hydrolase [Actinoplanes sp. TBRC 11911]
MMRPTLLLVHGAWHDKAMWDQLMTEMPDEKIRRIQNPSSAPVPANQLGDMYADARRIRDAALSIDGPVVAVAHSYGGAPTTEALAGLEDKVRRIVYLNAFMLDEGESLLGLVGGTPPPFWGTDHVGEGYYEMLDAENVFYADLEPAAQKAAADALHAHSVAAMNQPITKAAWKTIPSSYVIGELDNAVPKQAREFLAKRAQHTHRLQTGHSPFLVKPKELAELLRAELDLAEE